mgnify:CR=1 FL=1
MIYKSLERIQTVMIGTERIAGYHFHCRNMMNGKQRIFSVTASQVGDRDPREDAVKWRDGALIQNAFPYLYPNERELLITGFLPEDWENMDDLGE